MKKEEIEEYTESEDERLRELRLIIKDNFTSKGIYKITSSQLTLLLRSNSIFKDVRYVPQYITNTFKYLSDRGEVHKCKGSRGTYLYPIIAIYPGIGKIDLDRYYSELELDDRVLSKLDRLNNIVGDIRLEFDLYKKESVFTTMLENGTLTESNIEDRLEDVDDYEIIEFSNIWDLYKKISIGEYEKSRLSDSILKTFYKQLFKGLSNSNRVNVSSNSRVGEYVSEQNFISGGYLPCLLDNKLKELSKFFKFYNEEPKDIKEAFIRLGVISYWFAGIHIFSDGNSRTGRFLLSYYLYYHGITKKPNFLISESISDIGGKSKFVRTQVEAWLNKDITIYLKWFIESLIKYWSEN